MPHRSLPVLVLACLTVLASVVDAQQPRDPRPDVARPASAKELELQAALRQDPTAIASWLEIAKLQEQRGATADAEASLQAAVTQSGGKRELLLTLAGFYNRTGQFDKTMDLLHQAAQADPTDPKGYQLVATYYWEKAQKDTSLSAADKGRYLDEGLAATDRALALDGDYIEALTYKNILLRMKANLEADAVRRDVLMQEADALRNRALELSKARTGARPMAGEPAPPPPPPPPGADAAGVGGVAPVRVGGNIRTPTKIKDVPPVYPPEAHAARVSGMVILEAVIDAEGNVQSARVLRSIPMLDEAAVDAVKQWKFTPTVLDGVPTPVIMTVTVNFTIQ